MQLELRDAGSGDLHGRPWLTSRLDPGKALQFRIADLWPSVSVSPFALKLQAFLPVPFTHVQLLHASGASALHVAQVLIQEGQASGGQAAPTLARGGTRMPDGLAATGLLCHFLATFTCGRLNSMRLR